MNIFKKITRDQAKLEHSLGCRLDDTSAIERRLTYMASLTGGKGFRIPAIDPDGKRAGKKALARTRAERQHRKEREIGVDPIYKPTGQPLGVQARKDWQKRSKAWEQANG